jgi:hypothetical protein
MYANIVSLGPPPTSHHLESHGSIYIELSLNDHAVPILKLTVLFKTSITL